MNNLDSSFSNSEGEAISSVIASPFFMQ